MTLYLIQLHNDRESAILERWNVYPPHFFEMGLPERRLEPPAGYAGPPFGFGQEENEQTQDSFLAHLHLEDVFGKKCCKSAGHCERGNYTISGKCCKIPTFTGLGIQFSSTMPSCCRDWGLSVENVKTERGGNSFLTFRRSPQWPYRC